MRFIFLLFLLFAFSGCGTQNGVSKDYIISNLKEKEPAEIDSSK